MGLIRCGGLVGPTGRLTPPGPMRCIGFQVDLACSAFAALAIGLLLKGATTAAALVHVGGGHATARGGDDMGCARGGAQFCGADSDGACGGGGGLGGSGGGIGGGRWPWNCHGVSCHCEERECSDCVSDLNLLRCRRFWNHTRTHRADMPRCIDSLSLCSTSGCGSLSKAATSTPICFWVRLMRLVILESGALPREPTKCGRTGVCAASCRADWRPWNQALTVSGVVPLWAASSAQRAASSCGLTRKAVASACSAAVLHVVLMLRERRERPSARCLLEDLPYKEEASKTRGGGRNRGYYFTPDPYLRLIPDALRCTINIPGLIAVNIFFRVGTCRTDRGRTCPRTPSSPPRPGRTLVLSSTPTWELRELQP